MTESDWLDPTPLDQRTFFEGNSVLRGGQTPRIEAPRRMAGDLRISCGRKINEASIFNA
jgi:hypothetical protein